MDILYKIIGMRVIGKSICLTVDVIDKKEDFNTGKILGDFGGFMENMKSQATRSRNPDQISITFKEWKNNNYAIGDTISVSINKG